MKCNGSFPFLICVFLILSALKCDALLLSFSTFLLLLLLLLNLLLSFQAQTKVKCYVVVGNSHQFREGNRMSSLLLLIFLVCYFRYTLLSFFYFPTLVGRFLCSICFWIQAMKVVGFVQQQQKNSAGQTFSLSLCFASTLYPFSISLPLMRVTRKQCVYVFGTLFLSRPFLPSLPLCAWRA